VQNADSFLFDDLDAALHSGSSEKRVAMLRQVTDLFLSEALPPGSAPKPGHDKLKADFEKLSKPNAQRLLRFWQVREVSARSA
jgi:hypothetical protein